MNFKQQVRANLKYIAEKSFLIVFQKSYRLSEIQEKIDKNDTQNTPNHRQQAIVNRSRDLMTFTIRLQPGPAVIQQCFINMPNAPASHEIHIPGIFSLLCY